MKLKEMKPPLVTRKIRVTRCKITFYNTLEKTEGEVCLQFFGILSEELCKQQAQLPKECVPINVTDYKVTTEKRYMTMQDFYNYTKKMEDIERD
ncbi:MAG: hypothetical protein NC548_34045 [Lachnospiraceae bacterium]|nr:hypothetical protein [Lachnospiraceae bacterium]